MAFSKTLLSEICSKNTGKLIAASSVAVLLSACGGTGQDDGTASSFNQVFAGVGIDGHLARATVYLDTNNNGTRDSWEPFAFTDDEGYYSYNPNTNTNYCAADATSQQAQYCLRSNTRRSDVVVRIDGGYDILTGEPFVGQLSRRLTNIGETDVSDTVVSPLTSLLTNVQSSNDRSTLLNGIGIQEQDLNVDYLNTDGSNGVNQNLLNTALKVHKVVAVLSDRLTDTYTEIGEDFGTPNDASSLVYPNLAQQIIDSGNSLDNVLNNNAALANVMDRAENNLRSLYENRELTLPQDMGSENNPGAFQRVVNIASQIPSVVNTLIDINNSLTPQQVGGASRALETLVIKTVNEDPNSNDPSIDNVINFITPTNNLLNSLVSSLGEKTGDVASLVNNDFSGFNSEAEVNQAASLGSDVTPFSQIGGMQLRVSDLDLGTAPNNLKDREVEIYFNGVPTDKAGSFDACVKFIDEANVDGTLGEANTRGELIAGYWSMLGASENNEAYSLLMTLTFLGTTYQAIMKPAGTEMVNGVEYQKIRTDYDGEQLKAFHSATGFTSIASIPTTDSECQDRLPSRVGL